MLFERTLIEAAYDLARKGGRPREVALRRAVSSAYYAIFHALCRLCADELVGVTAPQEDRSSIYRSVEHSSLRVASRNARVNATLQNILARAIALQDKRHLADYDPVPNTFGGRAAVLSLIGSAEDAVAEIAALSPADRKTLAVVLIARPRK